MNRRALPLVSVLMTAYNREKFIGEAIESVLHSTYSNFELIVLDDCSTDKTVEIAQKFACTDSRIRVYVNKKNLGQFQNRNKAVDYASGKYILYVDSDDVLFQNAIEYIINQFQEFPEAKFATIYQGSDINYPIVLNPTDCIHKHFFDRHFLDNGPGGSMIEKEYFISIGKFPVKYDAASDMYYNIRAASSTSTILLPYIYLHYRRHEGQAIHDSYPYLYNNYRYMEEVLLLPELPITKMERKQLLLKNKRRFIIHSLVFLKNTFSFKKFFKAYKLAGFGVRQIFAGIFQL